MVTAEGEIEFASARYCAGALGSFADERGNEVMTQKETDKSLQQIMMFLLEVSDVNLFIAQPGC